jgi:hypothetical protein
MPLDPSAARIAVRLYFQSLAMGALLTGAYALLFAGHVWIGMFWYVVGMPVVPTIAAKSLRSIRSLQVFETTRRALRVLALLGTLTAAAFSVHLIIFSGVGRGTSPPAVPDIDDFALLLGGAGEIWLVLNGLAVLYITRRRRMAELERFAEGDDPPANSQIWAASLAIAWAVAALAIPPVLIWQSQTGR